MVSRGLSPLARGTPFDQLAWVNCVRFIPAGAGNTVALAIKVVNSAVYPRWRGEHVRLAKPSRCAIGLSPLARGTLQALIRWCCGDRFIPAGAGNTCMSCTECTSVPVYPRWRGEHHGHNINITTADGLSPLARGTQQPYRP